MANWSANYTKPRRQRSSSKVPRHPVGRLGPSGPTDPWQPHPKLRSAWQQPYPPTGDRPRGSGLVRLGSGHGGGSRGEDNPRGPAQLVWVKCRSRQLTVVAVSSSRTAGGSVTCFPSFLWSLLVLTTFHPGADENPSSLKHKQNISSERKQKDSEDKESQKPWRHQVTAAGK